MTLMVNIFTISPYPKARLTPDRSSTMASMEEDHDTRHVSTTGKVHESSLTHCSCSLYSLLGNAANTGPAVYIGLFIQEFYVGPAEASGLISYPNLAYGFGTLLLVPAYMKFGRRPVMLVSIVIVHLPKLFYAESCLSSHSSSPVSSVLPGPPPSMASWPHVSFTHSDLESAKHYQYNS
jgi:hypothetical protein